MPIYMGRKPIATEDELLTLQSRVAALEVASVSREVALPTDDPMEFETHFEFSQLLDVEEKGPRSTVAVSVFPYYDVVGPKRFRLRGSAPAPGTTFYVTYRKA